MQTISIVSTITFNLWGNCGRCLGKEKLIHIIAMQELLIQRPGAQFCLHGVQRFEADDLIIQAVLERFLHFHWF